jgi:hypothetical protein
MEINNKKVEKSMLNLKKTAVAVLAFGSSAVFAGTMGPVCAPGNVTVPCEATAWDFGVQALYLQTSFNGEVGRFDPLDSAYTDSYGDHYNHDHHDSDDWGWGFQLEGSYHFGTGNDATLSWYHFDDSHDHDDHHHVDGAVVGTDDDDHDHNGFRPHWDAVNLEFGQHVDFSQTTKIRFHAGAQYARIKTSGRLAYLTTNGQEQVITDSWERSASFNGFGPRVGSDLSYEVGNGFAFYGKAAATLLAGTTKYNVHNVAVIHNQSRTQIVPELEGKLGARYTYAMSSGDLTLDVGYMWIDYINARSALVTAASIPTTLAARDDFGLDGVYAGLKWVGNVA